MILPDPKDALHKAMLYRLLIALLDSKDVVPHVRFKGGTCAALLGWLDRFSIDLDFDLAPNSNKRHLRMSLKRIFKESGFIVDQEAKKELYFILKYQAPPGARSTLKISMIDRTLRSNVYRPQYLSDIGRYAICQTAETMFANKLVAVRDRFQKYHTIAGRDLYDIHHFFIQGYGFNQKVIVERTGKQPKVYLRSLIPFIETRVTEKIITEDLSHLLTPSQFQSIRHTLKTEVLVFLRHACAKI